MKATFVKKHEMAGSELKPSNQLYADLGKAYEYCIINQGDLK